MFRPLPYGTGSKKVTTDANVIKPGMIYVDLNEKSTESVYTAYNKGANLIITQHNISDSRLPVIKVNDIGSSYLKLLDILYGYPLEKVSFIPIYGGNRGNIVAKVLEQAFKKHFSKAKKCNDTIDFLAFTIPSKYNFYVEEFFYYVLNCIMRNNIIIPIPYDENLSSLESIIRSNSECEIIIECSSINAKNICGTKSGKIVLINIDEPYALTMIRSNNDNVIITYGLSKRAAVTATSIDYGEWTNFNYCLQRTLTSRTGAIIEPFEVPLSIKGLGINRIYAALASISCALYYDIDLNIIKESLMDYSDRGRDFLIKQYENFTLVDNHCTTLVDYKETFEMLQFIDYEGLYILISDSSLLEELSDKNIVKIINEFTINLNIKEIIYTPCFHGMFTNEEKNYFNRLKSFAKNQGLNIKHFYQLSYALKHIINTITKGDVLLTIGGKEMDSAITIIELILLN